MTTLQTFIDELRTSVEDPGDTIVDNFTGDATTTRWKLSSFPIKTNSETVTVAAAAKVRGVDYTLNNDNGEILFTTAPANAAAVVATYTKVVWRDERFTSAVNAGIRKLSEEKAYKIGEVYLLLRVNVYDYDLTSTTDVPTAASFTDQTMPSDYNPSTARADLVKGRTKIHWYEYRRYGANQVFTPYEFCRRSTPRNVHIDAGPGSSDTLKAVYTAPFTVLTQVTDTSDVPDEFYYAIVWYAMSVLLDKKEARRARSDSYQTTQNTNANPPGTQAQTADDYIARFNAVVPMRPFPMSQRRRLRSWQYYVRGSI